MVCVRVCIGGGGVSNRTGWSDVLFGVGGGESASCFSPFLRRAAANGDSSLKGLTLR